ncbi:MAG: hypothetical protein ACLU4N_01870 [Butyricimonas faecihominis]
MVDEFIFIPNTGEYQLEKAGGSYFIEAQQEGILSRLNVHLERSRKIREPNLICRSKLPELRRRGGREVRENERLWKEGMNCYWLWWQILKGVMWLLRWFKIICGL